MSELESVDKVTFQERRREERSEFRFRAVLLLDEKRVDCVVKNASPSGLLLEIGRHHSGLICREDTGKKVEVIFESVEAFTRSLHGIIVRVLVNDDIRVAAIAVVE